MGNMPPNLNESNEIPTIQKSANSQLIIELYPLDCECVILADWGIRIADIQSSERNVGEFVHSTVDQRNANAFEFDLEGESDWGIWHCYFEIQVFQASRRLLPRRLLSAAIPLWFVKIVFFFIVAHHNDLTGFFGKDIQCQYLSSSLMLNNPNSGTLMSRSDESS